MEWLSRGTGKEKQTYLLGAVEVHLARGIREPEVLDTLADVGPAKEAHKGPALALRLT